MLDVSSLLLASIPTPLVYVLSPFILIAVVLATTRAYTTIRYHVYLNAAQKQASGKAGPTIPPHVPYTIPILGHALSFLAPYPGQFWNQLFTLHPRSTGVCTLLLGGQKTHILFSPPAVHALFRARGPNRDQMNLEIIQKGFGMLKADVPLYVSEHGADEKMNEQLLLKGERANELTTHFSRVLADTLAAAAPHGDDEVYEVGLYAWVREHMFTASTSALYGERILQEYPDLCADFFIFDNDLLSLFFGIPKLLIPAAHRTRARLLSRLAAWNDKMFAECHGAILDPYGPIAWEPRYGSRIIRARQTLYHALGLTSTSRAALDLGFLFGLSSNAIPTTGWMLLHALDPSPSADPSLLPRILAELRSAQLPDGTLDVQKLITLPLLQSVFHEVMRLYVDVLVTRCLPADLTLPLDTDGKRSVRLSAHDIVLAPSWLGHRDADVWSSAHAPSDVFFAERFLTTDPATGAQVFSTTGTVGKLFPFGGGKTICPGRVFAKQEVLAAFAMVLLGYEVQALGFVDGRGRETEGFPGLRSAYAGSGAMAMEGDLRVRVRRRRREGAGAGA